jgi:hypothetical protein
MAEKLSDSEDEIRLGLLREIEETNQRIEEQNKKAAVAGAEERKRLEKRIEKEKEKVKLLGKQVKPLQEQNKLAEEYNDLQDTLQTSYTKLDIGARKLISTNKIGSTAFASLAANILDIKDKQAGLSEDELKINQRKLDVYTNLYTSITSQAEAASQTKNELLGVTEQASRRLHFEESIADLPPKEKEKLTDLFNLNENLISQQERLQKIQEEADDLYQRLPQFLQDGVDMAKKLAKGISEGLGPIVILGALLGAALLSFTEIQAASKKFREETGLTNSQTKQIQKDAHSIAVDFAKLGVDAEVAYDSIAAFKTEFGDSIPVSKAVAANVAVLNKNFGVAQSDAAAVNMVFQSMAGLSAETAQNVSQQVADMANLAGVAPSKVFKDIADSAEGTYTYFKGDVTLIAKQAIEARRLGTTLKDVLKTTESLLDFENGIEKELVAATFVGGQFNLSQARALAYAGKHVDAQKEILRQIERSGKFSEKDSFTKKVLADAAGMTVDELSKQILMQEKLGNLSDEEQKKISKAMDAGLDITNMSEDQLKAKTQELAKQEEIADKITQMENSFKGIVAAVGEGLLPLMEALAPIVTTLGNIFGGIFGALNSIPGLFPAIIGGLSVMYVLSKKTALLKMKEAIASIFAGNAKLGAIGLIAAGAGVAALMSYMGSAKVSDVGDVMSPANGKTRVSTKEGGLYELSPNDDLIAAPNAISKLNNASELGRMVATPSINTGGGGLQSKGIDMLVQEMKALRADMNSGKIQTNTYLDGQKVTTGIAAASERSSKNNFSYGQRY